MEQLRLEMTLLLPDMTNGDRCVDLLTDSLHHTRGISEAHVLHHNGSAQLCLHFDPNLLPLSRVERLAREAGAQITSRYRHEAVPISGLDVADAASGVADLLNALPGMLHAEVNYAAGLAFVAYDSADLDRTQILSALTRAGAGPIWPSPQEAAPEVESDAPSGHGVGSFGMDIPQVSGALPALSRWMEAQWPLLLLILAGILTASGWLGERFFALSPQASLILYVLAYLCGGFPIARHTVPALLRGDFDTDVLMLAAATGAAFLGEWMEGALLLFLFGLGHVGEHYALDRARHAMAALGALMPRKARVKRGDRIEDLAVEVVEVGDLVLVQPGDRIPVDGTIVQGQGAVDQSPITGESMPVPKEVGDAVFAGSVNQDAALDVRVTRLARDNTLSRVMTLVEEAQSQRSPSQQFAQTFTCRFVPLVLAGTALWIIVPPLLGWMVWSESFYQGMILLVAASPCALAIGTPAATLSGIAQAARNGVLIKGGVHLENLGALKAVAFDKTGTITQGLFQVVHIRGFNNTTEDDLMRVAAALEQRSNHPLAQAVVRAAQDRGVEWPEVNGLENVPGRGIHGEIQGEPVRVGSLKLFQDWADPTDQLAVEQTVRDLEADGFTTVVVGRNGQYMGVLGLADMPRPGVQRTMARLRELDVRHLVMLTGDNEEVGRRVAREVGLTDVRANLLPEEKLAAIRELEQQYGSIAMVGDGVNDAPALAAATVGLAMGGAGTAVALETADVALMADGLDKLPFAVGLSRASRTVIRQNLAISLGVIGLLIVTSVTGWVQLSWAVLLHEGSTVAVVLNALRLLGYRKGT